MFAIAAMRFMGGKFYSCNDGNAVFRPDCVGSYLNSGGVWSTRVWDKPNYNFDSFGTVGLSLCGPRLLPLLVFVRLLSLAEKTVGAHAHRLLYKARGCRQILRVDAGAPAGNMPGSLHTG